MPTYYDNEDEVVGMGLPKAVVRRSNPSSSSMDEERKQKLLDENSHQHYSQTHSNSKDSPLKQQEVAASAPDVKQQQPRSSIQDERISVLDAASLLQQSSEGDEEGEENPESAEPSSSRKESCPVKDPTFKVVLKTGSNGDGDGNVAGEKEEKNNKDNPNTDKDDVTADLFDSKKKIREIGGFTFKHLAAANFSGLNSKEVKKHTEKWGINYHISRYRFSEPFDPVTKDIFLKDLLSSKDFQQFACRTSARGQRKPSSRIQGKISSTVGCETLKSTVTSMSFFDRIQDAGLVSSNGECKLRGCFEDVIDGMTINSLLRKALVDEDSEQYDLFNEEDRKEVIFRLFRHLVFGGGTTYNNATHMLILGSLCQYEDFLTPYLDTCKAIYKDMVSVFRNKNTGKIEVKSHVYQLNEVVIGGTPLFPEDHELNVGFVSVDSMRRYVTFYYFAWPGAAW